MKTSLLKFLSILSFFVVISCYKDEVIQKGIITFTVNDSYYNYWIVLSDQSGKVLDWKTMTNGVTQTFSYTQNKDSVNLTLINKSITNDFYLIKTFVKVGPGDYSIKGDNIVNNSPAGMYTINVSSTYENGFDPQTENQCGDFSYHYTPDSEEIDIPLCGANSNLYAFIIDNQYNSIPRYLYSPSINPGETLVIDDNLFGQLKEMKSKLIAFNQPINGGLSLAVGNTIQQKRSFLASIRFSSDNTTSMEMFYPELTGTLFSSYVFYLIYTHSPQPNVHYYISKESQEPASSYAELNINFNLADSVSITPSKLSINSTGSGAHYIFSTFNYYNNSTTANLSAWWYVYSNFSNQTSINLPQFPDDLKNAVDLSFVSKLKSTEVAFVKDNSLGGYSSFYQKTLNKTGFTHPANPVDNTQIIYQFRSDVGTFNGRTSHDNLSRYKSFLKRHQ